MLLEVQIKVLEHQVQFLIAMHNILKPADSIAIKTASIVKLKYSLIGMTLPDNIVVLELFKQRYLSDRSTRNSLFFLLQSYLL